ncbi:MAG: SDR family NAD(P)-dependent oxidoreductase [Actinobacteria bacterium]|nr:MAG: SDR family NAD(P)-dependent oxidoreductase [Actinomycetota bacterium]
MSSFRSALVTGGRSGIGAALVAALEREGTPVRVLDLADGFDVGDPTAWEQVEPVELACLNAGVTTGTGDVAALTESEYRRVLGANVDGVVFGVRRLARVMERGGAIVVTASLAGLTTAKVDPGEARERAIAAGMELLRPEQIADAVLAAARDGSTGEAWVCLPGKAPFRHEFPRFFESA